MGYLTDIVFVNPPLSHEERYGVKFKGGGQTPPTGLAMLAAVCRNAGYSAGLVDAACLNYDFETTASKILEMKPKYVGITAVTVSIFNAYNLIEILKKKNNLFLGWGTLSIRRDLLKETSLIMKK